MTSLLRETTEHGRAELDSHSPPDRLVREIVSFNLIRLPHQMAVAKDAGKRVRTTEDGCISRLAW